MADAYSNRSGKSISGAISKAACIAKKDAKIYYFKPQILGFGILIPAFVYLSFSLGREIPSDLLIPGLVGMVSLFGASSVEAISITIEKQTETYEILQTAPVSTTTIVLGKSLAGSAFGIMLSLVTAVGAAAAEWGTHSESIPFRGCDSYRSFCFLCAWNVVCSSCEGYADREYVVDCSEAADDIHRWSLHSNTGSPISTARHILPDTAYLRDRCVERSHDGSEHPVRHGSGGPVGVGYHPSGTCGHCAEQEDASLIE